MRTLMQLGLYTIYFLEIYLNSVCLHLSSRLFTVFTYPVSLLDTLVMQYG